MVLIDEQSSCSDVIVLTSKSDSITFDKWDERYEFVPTSGNGRLASVRIDGLRIPRLPSQLDFNCMELLSRASIALLLICFGLAAATDELFANDSLTPSVEEAILEGVQFENEDRWQEAISLYEKQLRAFPENPNIFRRLQISRIHFDVSRRYKDPRFISQIEQIAPVVALNLYSEILTKLEYNYVEAVSLSQLIRNGTAFLEVALTEEDFRKAHLENADAEAVEEFRMNIHKEVLAQPINTHADARQMVATVAHLAEQKIGLSPTATIHEYVAGAIGLLDPYSYFMTAGELGDVMSQIEGNLIGIGVELWAEGEELRIIEAFEGGPAFQAGLTKGDEILSIDGILVSEIGAKKAADLLRGPTDSRVTMFVRDMQRQERHLQVVRRRVDVPSLLGVDMVDRVQGVGYLRISNFQKTTPSEFDRALQQLHAQGMRSLIIDLRRNPGGLLDAAVEIADRFISRGGIVSTRGRNSTENRNYQATYSGTMEIPLVVLIDKDSASASELFAAAIHDHDRGTIIGENSYGKGSVQGIYHTDTVPGGVRITVSKFFSPKGNAISVQGVRPDFAIDNIDDAFRAPPKSNEEKFVSTGVGKPNPPHTLRDRLMRSAKPPIGGDGESLADFNSQSQDLVLRKAIEIASRS